MNPHIDSMPNPDVSPTVRTHPKPIIHGHLIGARDGGHWVFTKPHWDDRFDLTSGECRMARVIRGMALSLRERAASEVARFTATAGRKPGHAVVLVGDDPASAV